jgi:N utilization substance protein B
MHARRVARELALLSITQLPVKQLQTQQIQNVLLAAVQTLTTEIRDTLETAAAELERGNDRLLSSETRATDLQSARAMVKDAMELTQTAINRLGYTLELPEIIQMSNQRDVRDYAIELLSLVQTHREEVDKILNESMVDWQMHRLARIDQDILRIAVTEMMYIGLAEQMAINEAVELSKRYSGEEGYRFINGVLRRVSDRFRNVVRMRDSNTN